MEAAVAAPLYEDSLKTTVKPKNTRTPHMKRKNTLNGRSGRRNLNRKSLYEEKEVEEWQNSCHSIDFDASHVTEANYNTSYDNVRAPPKASFDKPINASFPNIRLWCPYVISKRGCLCQTKSTPARSSNGKSSTTKPTSFCRLGRWWVVSLKILQHIDQPRQQASKLFAPKVLDNKLFYHEMMVINGLWLIYVPIE